MDIVLDSPGVYYFVSDVVNPIGNCMAGAKIKVTVVGSNEDEGRLDLESDEEEGVKTTPPTSGGEQLSLCSTFWFPAVAVSVLAFIF